jgi:catechol 2,3-dioxygenase-like lactoylglutathione lyase family enzyme
MNAEKFWEATMPVIKPALHHVTFKTARLDEMMAWYATVLGGKINFKDDHNGWMTNDQANHRFAFLSVPGLEDDPDKVKHNAMHHSAFEYESFSDLMSSYARMRDEEAIDRVDANVCRFQIQSHRDVFRSRKGVSSIRERPVVRGATAHHPRWEVLTGLDPQHRLADFRQHRALGSPMSSTLTALNASLS